MQVSIQELLHYTDEERQCWEQWFQENGEDLLKMPIAGRHPTTVGALVLDIFLTELRSVDLVRGEAAAETGERPRERVQEVFGFGIETRNVMRKYAGQASDQDWTRVVFFDVDGRSYRATARRVVLHALIEEMRQWAQLERIMRDRGFEPPENLGLLGSSALI